MLAEHNWLRSYMLLINDSPVAFFVGCQYNKAFEALEIGYDAEFSSLGVGSALSYMVIEDLYDSNKPAYLDFGFGENKYKSLICNHKSPASEAYITRTNMWGILVKLQIILSKLEKMTRSFLIQFHIDNSIRKILKRKK
jgi:CelD/BcsL family acetyltransferase involved in cellulose biosynthesis